MNKLIKLLTLSTSFIFIYLIYKNADSKFIYTAIGDNYNNHSYNYYDFICDDLREKGDLKYFEKFIKDDYLINDIYSKVLISNDLKKSLRDAKVLTISIGKNDIIYNSNKSINENNTIKDIKRDFNILLSEIKKYYKKNIYLIEIPLSSNKYKKLTTKVNNFYKDITKKDKKMYYIDTTDTNYPERQISKKILKMLEK